MQYYHVRFESEALQGEGEFGVYLPVKEAASYPVLWLLHGAFRQYQPLNPKLFVYERRSKSQRLLVICSYTAESVKFTAPKGYDLSKGRLILRSHGDGLEQNGFTTRPWETRVYLFQDRRRGEG